MFFLLFQICKERKVKVTNHRAEILDLRHPHLNQNWFWDPLRNSWLHDLVYIGYNNVSHAFLMTLCERWHTETSSSHLPVGEMTITLDDVACLLHIPIEGIMLSHPKKVSQADGVDLMVRHLGVTQAEAVENCKGEFGAYISYKALRKYYEDYLDVATRLLDAQTPEEVEERGRVKTACVKCYLLYLVGCMLFRDKSNKRIELIYVTTMEVIRKERRHGRLRMAICYGTIGRLTLRFCHLFRDHLRGQQMRSISLHTSGSSTKREARLILMR